MLNSAVLLALIELPLVIKIFVLSFFEWLFYHVYTGFTVYAYAICTKFLRGGPYMHCLCKVLLQTITSCL